MLRKHSEVCSEVPSEHNKLVADMVVEKERWKEKIERNGISEAQMPVYKDMNIYLHRKIEKMKP